MKCEWVKGSRTMRVTDLPVTHPSDYSELVIEIRYCGQGNGLMGIALDSHIIPRIVKALNDKETP